MDADRRIKNQTRSLRRDLERIKVENSGAGLAPDIGELKARFGENRWLDEWLMEGLGKPENRNRVLHGGRGGGKTWGVAKRLVLMAMQLPWLYVLCCREVLKSIDKSQKKILVDWIDKMGVGYYFHVTKTDIRCVSGATFSFAGIQDHTVESIKSYEGVNICWVEEAQSITEDSLKLLIPTIRGSRLAEIWWTFNPRYESDPVYQRFVAKRSPIARVMEMNWDKNEAFPQVLDLERQNDKLALAPEEYDHIWEGKVKRLASGAIYSSYGVDNRISREMFPALPDFDARWLGFDAGGTNPALVVIGYKCYRAQERADWPQHVGRAFLGDAHCFYWLARHKFGDGVRSIPENEIDDVAVALSQEYDTTATVCPPESKTTILRWRQLGRKEGEEIEGLRRCIAGFNSLSQGLPMLNTAWAQNRMFVDESDADFDKLICDYHYAKNSFEEYLDSPEKGQEDHELDAGRYPIATFEAQRLGAMRVGGNSRK